MKNLHIHIEVSSELFLKNPVSTELGRKIVSSGAELVNELGFEAFTFRKLGIKIKSPESSIYRYFENKHVFLIYLVSWYWGWIEYQIVFATVNVGSPVEKLKKSISVLIQSLNNDNQDYMIDKVNLRKIIYTESVKAFHTKDVDDENKKGFFKTYKKVVQRVSNFVLEINPTYEFPHMLISTVIEGVHQQMYFAEHLPSLTDVTKGKDSISKFYTNMVFRTIQ